MKLRRLLAIAIDYCLDLYIVLPICWFLNLNSIYITVLALILFSTKDILLKSTSLGKKIMKLKVLTEDGRIPNELVLILRNITIIIWPIEIILIVLINKRIGDIIFNTKIVQEK